MSLIPFCLRAGAEPLISKADSRFLDNVERAGILFFWEQADAVTGLIKDRSAADGLDVHDVASIASTGFGLTSLCIADERKYLPHDQVLSRVRHSLRFLWEKLPQKHGFFYHFVNVHSGARAWRCEVSSIDTAILICGVLTCRQHFKDDEIRSLAGQIYERVDWPWMRNSGQTLSMGWKPESGFLKSRWDSYNEGIMIYLLAIASPTHPLPSSAWKSFKRPTIDYAGLHYIDSRAPLFTYQYPLAWFDLRNKHDQFADYFQNSASATRAHRCFCIGLHNLFHDFGPDLWGITSSDSSRGYVAWGGPPLLGPIDGTVVPAASGGSIPFLPDETIYTLRTMQKKFGSRVWKRYGFVDAFNPQTGWFDPDVIGIDTGITVVMAENARSRFVWQTFMRNDEARRALSLAGFRGGAGTDSNHPKEKNKVPRAGSCGALNQGTSP